MMNHNALAVYSILVILVSAVYLPMLYDKIFMDEVEKTHLFYSPVSQDFIPMTPTSGPWPWIKILNPLKPLSTPCPGQHLPVQERPRI